jgi:hypothetical protein
VDCRSLSTLKEKSIMLKMTHRIILAVGMVLALGQGRAEALPGQTIEEVAAWIQAHPTLQPASGETLLVRKSDTAAQRFTFQAAISPPGRATAGGSSGMIRSEQISLFDVINGVSRDRLEESLRTIYGLDLYQDFAQAVPIYQYPSQETLDQAQRQNTPLLAALQGEVREGRRYAYWLEVAQSRSGLTYTGQITVFLKEDMDNLEIELRNR